MYGIPSLTLATEFLSVFYDIEYYIEIPTDDTELFSFCIKYTYSKQKLNMVRVLITKRLQLQSINNICTNLIGRIR